MANVAVLGCGPGGLLVAHAVEQAGHTPLIISRKQKSVIPGSLHLQEAIPGVTSPYPDSIAQFVRIGTEEGYAQKVYDDPNRETGWSKYDGVYKSWNAHTAYDNLWHKYENKIIHLEDITAEKVKEMLELYDLVISTLPQIQLCEKTHSFRWVPYWIITLPTPEYDKKREILVFNGLPSDDWYRWSILGGVSSIEFTKRPEGFASDLVKEGVKAIDNDCSCLPEMVRAGRWAEWRHGVLLQHAYHKAVETVRERL